ncbi:hypothetical protein OQA88_6639 [Cercophora sp. LCS_1]
MTSITVAIAGGTGPLGRTIVDELLRQGKHKVIILARKSTPELEAKLGAPIMAADYANPSSLAEILTTSNVHTVISTLDTNNSGPAADLALIAAADASPVTKRYIPSIWGFRVPKSVTEFLPQGQAKIEVEEAIAKTGLEWAVVCNGYFPDYYLLPTRVPSHITPWALLIDIPNNKAFLPGTGTTPLVFTHTTDIAHYVVALLDLPKWEKVVYIVGDRLTLKEFVSLAEEAKGVKFDVTYDAGGDARAWPEDLRKFRGFGRTIDEGWLDVGREEGAWVLNEVLGGETKKVGDLMRESWGAN